MNVVNHLPACGAQHLWKPIAQRSVQAAGTAAETPSVYDGFRVDYFGVGKRKCIAEALGGNGLLDFYQCRRCDYMGLESGGTIGIAHKALPKPWS
jgi:hypothetical protein